MAPFLSETEMDRVGLMMGQGCFARTDRMDIKSETKLMLIEVMAKEDKAPTDSIQLDMVTIGPCRHFCLSYHFKADHITVESDLFIQISNDQPSVFQLHLHSDSS